VHHSNFPKTPLLENVRDCRKGGRRKILVFSPVGSLAQLDEFNTTIGALGIGKEVDFLFIYRKGLAYCNPGLSAIHATERHPLGTSGCFFEGQALGYRLGYETIVVADLDSVLDSRRTFYGMVRMARRMQAAILPRYRIKENLAPIASNVNNWGVYPRAVFEKAGFSVPYVWKGSEDYEFGERLRSHGAVSVYAHGSFSHHFSGFTAYHKMAEKKKYYPYINGTLKAILFVSEYKGGARLNYIAWHCFYYFFADALSDSGLKKIIGPAHLFRILEAPDFGKDRQFFAIKKVRGTGSFSNTSPLRVLQIPYSLASLALFGKYHVYTDIIELAGCTRLEFAARLAFATLLLPARAAQACLNLAAWKKERKKVHFPPNASNLAGVEGDFLKLVRDKAL